MTSSMPPPVPPDYRLPRKYQLSDPSPVDNGLLRIIAWVVILVSVGALGLSNYRESKRSAAVAPTGKPAMPFEIVGRYAIGVSTLGSAKTAASATLILTQVDTTAQSPAEKLAAVAVTAELQGKTAALARLDHFQKTLPKELVPQAQAMRLLYTRGLGSVSLEQRAQLEENLGWFGKLADTFGLPDNNPQRLAVIAAARRTLWTAIGFLFVGGTAFIAGIVLFVIFLVKLVNERLPRNYQPTFTGGGVFLEAFAIYIGGMTLGSFSSPLIPPALRRNIPVHIAIMFVPTAVAMFWPIIRGSSVGAWKAGLGWHTGRGFFREIGLGIVGYIAGLPILALGLFITTRLIGLSHAHPSHPIDHMLGVSPQLTLIVLMLASVYAPLTEETMFRGAFFNSLRSRHGWLLSAVVSSFIFAAVHPQGWTVVPTLMAIAIVFAGIREWRGTIFSSAAAHCLHNTALVLMMTLMLS